jgi:hypothetical protein
MALPLVPIVGLALRYGTVAFATYAVTRKFQAGRIDQRAEDAMDGLQEGVTVRKDKEQINGTGRFNRTVRFGDTGPGVEIDISALGRIKFRKV